MRRHRRDRRADERPFRRPASIDGRLRDAGALGDRVDGEVAVAAGVQKMAGDCEDFLVRSLAARTAAAALRCVVRSRFGQEFDDVTFVARSISVPWLRSTSIAPDDLDVQNRLWIGKPVCSLRRERVRCA
jgi:hypothetical protein